MAAQALRLQQYLPFTVLKHHLSNNSSFTANLLVATVPTVYGIETIVPSSFAYFFILVATVPTVYGIETSVNLLIKYSFFVATVPTVYGIETLSP